MKAFIIKTNTIIQPFGDASKNSLILNRELSKIQEEVLNSIGIDFEKVNDFNALKNTGECIFFHDDLYFTKDLLLEFINKSRKSTKSTVCALKKGLVTLRTVASTQDVKFTDKFIQYPLFYSHPSMFDNNRIPVIIDPEEFIETIKVPEHMFGSEGYSVPSSTKVLVRVGHWVNLWAANISAVLSRIAYLRKSSKLKLFSLAMRAGSINQWKILKKTNKIGKDCDIHPDAYVEGSRIGDKVEIGAGSVVRFSEIGDDVSIGNNVTINFSVIGEKSAIFDGIRISFSVLYPGSMIDSWALEAAIIGKDTFIGGTATLTDFRLDKKTVKVMKDGELVDTNNHVIGICIGHGAYLGSGINIAPGREIPNEIRILPDKGSVITKIETGKSGKYRIVNP